MSLIAIVAMMLIGRHSPDTPRNSAKVSWSSTVLVATGLFALNYALVSGPKDGWASATVIIPAIAAVALLAAFVILQLRLGDDALLDLRLFKVPSFTAAMILSFTARLVTFGVLPYLVFWLSGLQGRTAIQVGLVLLALALPMVMVAAPSSALEKTGKLNLVTGAAMVITGVGLLWLGLIMDPSLTWKTSIFPLLVIGIGTGVAMPHMMNLALAVAPADRSGAATRATNTAFPLGTAVGVAIFGAILSSHVDKLDWAPEQVREAASEGRLDILAKVLDSAQLQDAIDMFTGGLSVVLLMAAGFSAVCAVICFAAIRNRDRIGDGAPPTRTMRNRFMPGDDGAVGRQPGPLGSVKGVMDTHRGFPAGIGQKPPYSQFAAATTAGSTSRPVQATLISPSASSCSVSMALAR